MLTTSGSIRIVLLYERTRKYDMSEIRCFWLVFGIVDLLRFILSCAYNYIYIYIYLFIYICTIFMKLFDALLLLASNKLEQNILDS